MGNLLRAMPEQKCLKSYGELNKEYKDKGFQVVGMPIDVLNQGMAVFPGTG